jgi:hypothetical protein
VIAVFTKYDQFRREVRMKLEDQQRDPETDLDGEMESIFKQYYLVSPQGPPPFIRLESEDFVDQLDMHYANFGPVEMHRPGQACTGLIEMTAKAVSSGAALILLAIQKDNLELNIKYAVER